jgi:S1-C subfamily serine protease
MNKAKFLLGMLLLLAGCTLVSVGGRKPISPHLPETHSEYAKTAVMITSTARNSGGTGVILDSHPGASHILTNKHVCQLIQVGGLVVTDSGQEHSVDSYRVYPKHDLCLITVHADLGINIKVADQGPKDYETSIVVGHPSLLPTMITIGHFSQKRVISLVIDMQACDGTETPEEATMCVLFGAKPVFRNFASRPTSATIMPGSSGSAVYNAKGELSGLVFAGNQGLSYGFLVPWEYIHDFLKYRNQYKEEIPRATNEPRNFFTSYFKLERTCDAANTPKICNSFKRLGLWFE